MSSDKKVTRHTIKNDELQPFYFLGVVSSEPDYRLSVMINIHLGSDLRKCSEEITLATPEGTLSFSRFTPDDTAFSLVSNRNSTYILIRRLKNIDFLIIPGTAQKSDRKHAEVMAKSLREIPEITAVFIFDSREINDRNLELLLL